MKVGDTVETVVDFEDVREAWALDYPRKGDILTISSIEEHPNRECRKKGLILLYFKESPAFIGVCDKTIYGDPNFVLTKRKPKIVGLTEAGLKNLQKLKKEMQE